MVWLAQEWYLSLFICGTDTGIGKTHVAAAIMYSQHQRIIDLRYWKPVQTGSGEDDDRQLTIELSGVSNSYFLPTTLSFKEPLSPHRAAELENYTIELEELLRAFHENVKNHSLLIEGAGGLLVPINRRVTWLDFLKETGLPVLLVARSGLGTINHSLLTLEQLRRHQVGVAGIVFCGPTNQDNMRTIEEFAGVRRLGVMVAGANGRPDIKHVFDDENALEQLLRAVVQK